MYLYRYIESLTLENQQAYITTIFHTRFLAVPRQKGGGYLISKDIIALAGSRSDTQNREIATCFDYPYGFGYQISTLDA